MKFEQNQHFSVSEVHGIYDKLEWLHATIKSFRARTQKFEQETVFADPHILISFIWFNVYRF